MENIKLSSKDKFLGLLVAFFVIVYYYIGFNKTAIFNITSIEGITLFEMLCVLIVMTVKIHPELIIFIPLVIYGGYNYNIYKESIIPVSIVFIIIGLIYYHKRLFQFKKLKTEVVECSASSLNRDIYYEKLSIIDFCLNSIFVFIPIILTIIFSNGLFILLALFNLVIIWNWYMTNIINRINTINW